MISVRSLTINGSNAVVPLSATTLLAKWVQVVTPSGNTNNVLVGGPEVSSTVGFPIPKGWAGQMLPDLAGYPSPEPYDLAKINCYVSTGDTLHILYGA